MHSAEKNRSSFILLYKQNASFTRKIAGNNDFNFIWQLLRQLQQASGLAGCDAFS